MGDLIRSRQLVREWRSKQLVPDAADETLARLISALLGRERDLCAKLADDVGRRREGEARAACESVAASIRARSKSTGRPAVPAAAEGLIRTFLRLNNDRHFCHHCLARELRVSSHDAHVVAERLTSMPGFESGFFWCSRCAESRYVLRFVGTRARR